MGDKPLPDGVDPDEVTWVDEAGYGSQDGYYEHDETGERYVPDPGRVGHWPHWDIQGADGKDKGRFPEKSLKPHPGQRRPAYGGQSATDPWLQTIASSIAERVWRWLIGSPGSASSGAPVYAPGLITPAPGAVVPGIGLPGLPPTLIPALVP